MWLMQLCLLDWITHKYQKAYCTEVYKVFNFQIAYKSHMEGSVKYKEYW